MSESDVRADPARVITERHGRVLLIRLQRPAKRNAIDAAMTAALDAAFDELDDNPDLWCGVLSGGRHNFCAGTDLIEGPGESTIRGGRYGVVGRPRAKPLVAAVEGFAYGGGLELALASDIVVAGRSARFGLPEVTHGVVANAGALFRAHQPLPLNIAKQMLLTGRPITADRAHSCGFVNEIVDDGAAERSAITTAEQIAANAPVAVQATLHAISTVVRGGDGQGWLLTSDAEEKVRNSTDFQEGLRAFREKRPARWQGN
ncbi:enoyl-CoA hydratase-related protein [Rhodococcus sp. NPDC056960]|uniref:enoyl-CoA hydratase-related protein n=1 Tax=Rhodococcus sp. NPDC056960 TaxID=3345982 RepID=UPI003642AB4B